VLEGLGEQGELGILGGVGEGGEEGEVGGKESMGARIGWHLLVGKGFVVCDFFSNGYTDDALEASGEYILATKTTVRWR
jgi:hypothetical protein